MFHDELIMNTSSPYTNHVLCVMYFSLKAELSCTTNLMEINCSNAVINVGKLVARTSVKVLYTHTVLFHNRIN